MKDAYHHDRFLVRLEKDQIVAIGRHHEPADLSMAFACPADSPAQSRMLGEEIGQIQDGCPHLGGGGGIVSCDMPVEFLEVARLAD
jgi:hypothetical protein